MCSGLKNILFQNVFWFNAFVLALSVSAQSREGRKYLCLCLCLCLSVSVPVPVPVPVSVSVSVSVSVPDVTYHRCCQLTRRCVLSLQITENQPLRRFGAKKPISLDSSLQITEN